MFFNRITHFDLPNGGVFRCFLLNVQQYLQGISCFLVPGYFNRRSHLYDSQSNGGTESGVRALRGTHRTLRSCLEKRLGRKIPVNHPIAAWLLEFGAITHNAVHRGQDGRTAWHRARGRPYGQNLYAFAEQVLYKLPVKGPKA